MFFRASLNDRWPSVRFPDLPRDVIIPSTLCSQLERGRLAVARIPWWIPEHSSCFSPIAGVSQFPQGYHMRHKKWKSLSRVDSLRPHGLLYSPWNSPGPNTGVSSLSLLQGIFPTQGSNPSLPNCRWILYQMSHKGSPRILEWVAYPFSRDLKAWHSMICCVILLIQDWKMMKNTARSVSSKFYYPTSMIH